MRKPRDIPQDIWDVAVHWWREGGCSTGGPTTYVRAIMDDRKRRGAIVKAVTAFTGQYREEPPTYRADKPA